MLASGLGPGDGAHHPGGLGRRLQRLDDAGIAAGLDHLQEAAVLEAEIQGIKRSIVFQGLDQEGQGRKGGAVAGDAVADRASPPQRRQAERLADLAIDLFRCAPGHLAEQVGRGVFGGARTGEIDAGQGRTGHRHDDQKDCRDDADLETDLHEVSFRARRNLVPDGSEPGNHKSLIRS
ncbi:hypothetical protein [Magnetospirillum sp. LM-5]|uniref:hypothetical protein n=1 Tax=Magnetospirillum sp. LM-5 TaxID=2681466 RepID=UPI00156E678C|nr:hypothetical protein [Magnetospirillum sp. LM-5]